MAMPCVTKGATGHSGRGPRFKDEAKRRSVGMRIVRAGLLTAIALLAPAASAAAVPLTRISSDPFTNATSQHATEVEPDTFAHHGTVVTAFQVGRFFNGGATDIGAVRSGDGGTRWHAPASLPGRTSRAAGGSPYAGPSPASSS